MTIITSLFTGLFALVFLSTKKMNLTVFLLVAILVYWQVVHTAGNIKVKINNWGGVENRKKWKYNEIIII